MSLNHINDLFGHQDIELGYNTPLLKNNIPNISENNDKFIEIISSVILKIKKLNTEIDILNKIHTEDINSVSSKKHELYQQYDNINVCISDISLILKGIKKNINSMNKNHINMYSYQTDKFTKIIRNYQDLQNKIKIDNENNIKRQYEIIIGQDLPNSDIDTIIKSQELMKMKKSMSLEYLMIDEKYNEIIKIEQSLIELYQLFEDMNILVDKQQFMLDNIENIVNETDDKINSGNKELEKTKKYQKSSRKKLCCIVICIILFLLIISFILGFYKNIF